MFSGKKDQMNLQVPSITIGWILALLVLVLVVVFFFTDQALDRELVLGMFGLLALSRLV